MPSASSRLLLSRARGRGAGGTKSGFKEALGGFLVVFITRDER
jgi:hypothetical protein